jgi:hypothetical protein
MNRRNFIFGMVALAPGPAFAAAKPKAVPYRGAEVVEFTTPEKRGTVIVNTEEMALYHIIVCRRPRHAVSHSRHQ